jgi:hypothetical protein
MKRGRKSEKVEEALPLQSRVEGIKGELVVLGDRVVGLVGEVRALAKPDRPDRYLREETILRGIDRHLRLSIEEMGKLGRFE